MEIQILEPKHVSNPRDAFVVTCQAMVGDGDDYYPVKLAPIYGTPGYESQLGELIALLQAMTDFQWEDTNSYSELEGFSKWFPFENHANDGWDGGNPFIDKGFIATLNSYEIIYCDNDGVEHGVSVEN